MHDPRPEIIAATVLTVTIAGSVAAGFAVFPAVMRELFSWEGLLWGIGGLCSAFLLVAAVVLVASIVEKRNARALSTFTLGRLEVDARFVLRRFFQPVTYRGLRRPLVGEEELDWAIDLHEVRYICWMDDLGGDTSALLWEATDRPLYELSLNELAADPAVRQAVIGFFDDKKSRGEFDTDIDLRTGEWHEDKRLPLSTLTVIAGGVSVRSLQDDTFAAS